MIINWNAPKNCHQICSPVSSLVHSRVIRLDDKTGKILFERHVEVTYWLLSDPFFSHQIGKRKLNIWFMMPILLSFLLSEKNAHYALKWKNAIWVYCLTTTLFNSLLIEMRYKYGSINNMPTYLSIIERPSLPAPRVNFYLEWNSISMVPNTLWLLQPLILLFRSCWFV